MNLSGRLTAVMIALVVLTAIAVGLLTFRNVDQVVLPRGLDRVDLQAELVAQRLEAAVQSVRADVLGFRSAVAIEGMMRARLAGGISPVDGISFTQWRDRMAARFVAELMAKPLITQFRVIGAADGGRELLRVDRSGPAGAIRNVPEGELQAKGDRPYFRDTIRLPDGQVHVSDVELNQEGGAIETPHVPVLRASTPIYTPDRQPFGIVIISLDLRPVLETVRQARASGQVFLVNARGDYLVHPDPSREFGFELGRLSRLQDDFAELAGVATATKSAPRMLRDRAGALFGVGVATAWLALGPHVAVVVAVPEDEILSPNRAIRDASLLAGTIAVLAAIVLAILVARSLTRPLVQITEAVERFVPGAPITVPPDAAGEVGVLARAFTRMSAEVAENTATIRRNAEIFDLIMGSMVDLVILFDADGPIVYANPAARAALGSRVKPGDRLRLNALPVFQADGVTPLPPEVGPARRALDGENVDNMELVLHPDGGAPMHLVVSARPIRGDGGTPKGAVVVARDVTQVREAERQLRQSQRLDAIGQLTGGVAHDFNNILTVITGTIELLAEAVADQPRLADYARMIDDASMRGAELTRQLLAFARRQPLQPVETDVNTLVIDAARLLQPTLGEHIEIESMLEEEAWPALIDPSQLSSALLNLAVNARDAMPEGGKLTLETGNVVLDEVYAAANREAQPGEYVMIAVSDTGVGIPAAIREQVFEPFFTTKQLGKGTGLGLSMVYGFVKQSDGHIKLYSEEGHGTTIKLYLPRSLARAAAERPAPVVAPVGGGEVILVVEDDDMVRAHVITQLESLGYRTLAASDGPEALGLIDGGAAFDLLFTDVIMPGGLNGRQLADAAAQRRPGLRVLYTSGYTENAIVHHGRLDPGVALLNKPYRKADLAKKVREVLTR
jgi:signal transduction histidine kinase/HAMP domain-containing protein